MDFKIKPEKKIEEKKFHAPMEDIMIQSQCKESDKIPMEPPIYSLSWCLKYSSGREIESDWTPRLNPSIKTTLEKNSDPELISIMGRNLFGLFEIELARINYSLVEGFGYIAESSGLVSTILGMWVRLKDGRKINSYRNGLVIMEVSK